MKPSFKLLIQVNSTYWKLTFAHHKVKHKRILKHNKELTTIGVVYHVYLHAITGQISGLERFSYTLLERHLHLLVPPSSSYDWSLLFCTKLLPLSTSSKLKSLILFQRIKLCNLIVAKITCICVEISYLGNSFKTLQFFFIHQTYVQSPNAMTHAIVGIRFWQSGVDHFPISFLTEISVRKTRIWVRYNRHREH